MRSLKTVDPISRPDLAEMHTGSLLARSQQLRSLHESFEQSDWTEQERESVADKIVFKNTRIWKDAWHDVKEVIGGREHLERGNKKRRQQAAFEKQGR